MQGVTSVTWLLPVAPIVFIAYVIYAILGLTTWDLPVLLIIVPVLPAIVITWIALIVAFVDVSRRPKIEMSDEARMVWILLLALLNVLALIPYWLLIIRRNQSTSS